MQPFYLAASINKPSIKSLKGSPYKLPIALSIKAHVYLHHVVEKKSLMPYHLSSSGSRGFAVQILIEEEGESQTAAAIE